MRLRIHAVTAVAWTGASLKRVLRHVFLVSWGRRTQSRRLTGRQGAPCRRVGPRRHGRGLWTGQAQGLTTVKELSARKVSVFW